MSTIIQEQPADVVLLGLGVMSGDVAVKTTLAGLKVVGITTGPYWSYADDLRPDEVRRVGRGLQQEVRPSPAALHVHAEAQLEPVRAARPEEHDRAAHLAGLRRGWRGQPLWWADGPVQPLGLPDEVGHCEQVWTGLYEPGHPEQRHPGLAAAVPRLPPLLQGLGAGDRDNRDQPGTVHPRFQLSHAIAPRHAPGGGVPGHDGGDGLHPFPLPTSLASEPYVNQYGVSVNACVYDGWCGEACNYACETGAKANSAFRTIPAAMKTGNLDMRLDSYVFRIDVDPNTGLATASRYYDAMGNVHVQPGKVFFNGIWGLQHRPVAQPLRDRQPVQPPHGHRFGGKGTRVADGDPVQSGNRSHELW